MARETLSPSNSARMLPLLWHLLPWIFALAIIPFGPQFLSLGTQIVIWILFAMSVDLVLGYAGIVTLGHGVFFGVGAYAAGLYSVHISPEPLMGHLVAVLIGGAFAGLAGAMTLHTRGVTFLILSMAVSAIVYEAANQLNWLTGGDDGLQGISIAPVFGIFRFSLFTKTAYLYSLAILFIWFVIAWCVVHSPFGRSLDGIRQNPRRMHAIGTPVWWRLLAIYVIAGAMAASAGALSAQTTRYVGLSVLSLATSGVVMVMLILGGTRRLYGAFVGTFVYVVVQDSVAKINPHMWELIVGLMLILAVLFFEGGLLGLPGELRRYWRASRKSGDGNRGEPRATPIGKEST